MANTRGHIDGKAENFPPKTGWEFSYVAPSLAFSGLGLPNWEKSRIPRFPRLLRATRTHARCASCDAWVRGFEVTAVLQMGLPGTCVLTSSLSSSSWFFGGSHGRPPSPHLRQGSLARGVLAQVPGLATPGAASRNRGRQGRQVTHSSFLPGAWKGRRGVALVFHCSFFQGL